MCAPALIRIVNKTLMKYNIIFYFAKVILRAQRHQLCFAWLFAHTHTRTHTQSCLARIQIVRSAHIANTGSYIILAHASASGLNAAQGFCQPALRRQPLENLLATFILLGAH